MSNPIHWIADHPLQAAGVAAAVGGAVGAAAASSLRVK